MNERRVARLGWILLLGFAALAAPELSACTWKAEEGWAKALNGTNGTLVTDHFGQITSLIPNGCAHSRKTVLEAKALRDNKEVWEHKVIGQKANLGAFQAVTKSHSTCSGVWVASTAFGTRYLALDFWLRQDVSLPRGASCPPPTPIDPPAPCSAGVTETTTWLVGTHGGTRPAPHQLGFGLSRQVERFDGSFLMDEFAMVSFVGEEPTVRFASTDAYRSRVASILPSLPPQATLGGHLLVVEAAEHPRNNRHIELPAVRPADLPLNLVRPLEKDGYLWFRAEIDKVGRVEQLLFLERSTDLLDIEEARRAIRQGLRLAYESSDRHRVVAFGAARVTQEGQLTFAETLVTLPRCCCGGEGTPCI